jgi:hypothetical protein
MGKLTDSVALCCGAEGRGELAAALRGREPEAERTVKPKCFFNNNA